MNLTRQQESLLKDLLRNDVWQSLLDDLAPEREVHPWKPGGDEMEKHAKWAFESGAKAGVEGILTLLRLGH